MSTIELVKPTWHKIDSLKPNTRCNLIVKCMDIQLSCKIEVYESIIGEDDDYVLASCDVYDVMVGDDTAIVSARFQEDQFSMACDGGYIRMQNAVVFIDPRDQLLRVYCDQWSKLAPHEPQTWEVTEDNWMHLRPWELPCNDDVSVVYLSTSSSRGTHQNVGGEVGEKHVDEDTHGMLELAPEVPHTSAEKVEPTTREDCVLDGKAQSEKHESVNSTGSMEGAALFSDEVSRKSGLLNWIGDLKWMRQVTSWVGSSAKVEPTNGEDFVLDGKAQSEKHESVNSTGSMEGAALFSDEVSPESGLVEPTPEVLHTSSEKVEPTNGEDFVLDGKAQSEKHESVNSTGSMEGAALFSDEVAQESEILEPTPEVLHTSSEKVEPTNLASDRERQSENYESVNSAEFVECAPEVPPTSTEKLEPTNLASDRERQSQNYESVNSAEVAEAPALSRKRSSKSEGVLEAICAPDFVITSSDSIFRNHASDAMPGLLSPSNLESPVQGGTPVSDADNLSELSFAEKNKGALPRRRTLKCFGCIRRKSKS